MSTLHVNGGTSCGSICSIVSIAQMCTNAAAIVRAKNDLTLHHAKIVPTLDGGGNGNSIVANVHKLHSLSTVQVNYIGKCIRLVF